MPEVGIVGYCVECGELVTEEDIFWDKDYQIKCPGCGDTVESKQKNDVIEAWEDHANMRRNEILTRLLSFEKGELRVEPCIFCRNLKAFLGEVGEYISLNCQVCGACGPKAARTDLRGKPRSFEDQVSLAVYYWNGAGYEEVVGEGNTEKVEGDGGK